jgi:peroxiredoxin Q/BCP
MRRLISASALFAVIALSGAWAGWSLIRQRPTRPVAGSFHRSTVDGSGHTRGIVQVALMRQLMADQEHSTLPVIAPGGEASPRVPSQDHPLLDRPAPPFVLEDARGKTWKLGETSSEGPVVVVFYLGSTCMACVTHLVELDFAMPRFRERRAQVLAVSADTPEFSRERTHKFGDFQIPLLSDADHATAVSYGVWKPIPGAGKDDGESLHATFVVDGVGSIRWAHVGNRPFTDVDALLAALDQLKRAPDNPP